MVGQEQQRCKKAFTYSVLIAIIAGSAFFAVWGSIWVYRTYGILSAAMTNEAFLNFLKNKRSLFLKEVILPSVIFFLICGIAAYRAGRFKRVITVLCGCGFPVCMAFAGWRLDAVNYLSREMRLLQAQWYDDGGLVIHALGEIDGKTYTNSKEALENSYQYGNRYMECDFILTSDERLVACHDWEVWNQKNSAKFREMKREAAYIPGFEEFMETKVMGEYTPLSAEDLIEFMRQNEDLYLITDSKSAEPEYIQKEFANLKKIAIDRGCEEVLDRFVIQIYHAYMHEVIDEIYPFPNYIFTLYQEGYRGEPDKMEEYAEFCMQYDIDVITMSASYYSDELSEICERYGLQLYVHTVNNEDEISAYLAKGVGVYTDLTGLADKFEYNN